MTKIEAKLQLAEAMLLAKGEFHLAEKVRLAREDVVQQGVQVQKREDTKEDLLTLLKEKGDVIITVFKSLDPDDDLLKKSKRFYDQVKALQNLMRDLGTKLMDTVSGKKADPELAKALDQSDIGELKDGLTQRSKELGDLLQVSQLLKSYATKANNKKEIKPVKHKLPKKNKQEAEKAEIKPKKEKGEGSKKDVQQKIDDLDKLI